MDGAGYARTELRGETGRAAGTYSNFTGVASGAQPFGDGGRLTREWFAKVLQTETCPQRGLDQNDEHGGGRWRTGHR
jgi:hypothetical protein